jgi:hypothetical protein
VPLARHAPRVRPPPPPPLRPRRARPLSPQWRSSVASASPPGRSTCTEEVVVPVEHCSVYGLGDGSGASGLWLGGGVVLIQYVDLIDAVVIGVGNEASALGTRPGWRSGWGRAQRTSSASSSSMLLCGDGGGGPIRCVWGMGLPLKLLPERRPKLDLTETQYQIWFSSPLEIALGLRSCR